MPDIVHILEAEAVLLAVFVIVISILMCRRLRSQKIGMFADLLARTAVKVHMLEKRVEELEKGRNTASRTTCSAIQKKSRKTSKKKNRKSRQLLPVKTGSMP